MLEIADTFQFLSNGVSMVNNKPFAVPRLASRIRLEKDGFRMYVVDYHKLEILMRVVGRQRLVLFAQLMLYPLARPGITEEGANQLIFNQGWWGYHLPRSHV